MGRLRVLVLIGASLAPVVVAAAMVSHVPPSAYVVPAVHIATDGEPIRFTPEQLGAHRTERGLHVDQARLESAVDQLAQTYSRPGQPGTYELSDSGVVMRSGTPGTELDLAAAKAALMDALRGTPPRDPLPLREVAPPPAPSHAIVVRLSQFRLELYEGTRPITHFAVGVGALNFPTPPGAYFVKSKARNPVWRNPGSRWARSMPSYIPAGPRNPLGTRALRLDRDAIVIHGTPNPSSVGRRSSHGCVRMRRADVERLFDMVPVGTQVFIVP
jgi:lipoprotein-anchoring transpeptidase ErfK/SrfK